ncbi:MAG: porin [Methylobacter sp.]|uniref:OprO/OprP family phosphate-selective porin n=1 Tax=Methylobacter sp. TaxID=2051955 RepID=UPI00258C634B|nr:porin [Methylobacter sp.]MCL7419715.1 porin [Methylobacter sp.]
MIKKQLAAAVSVGLLGSLATTQALASEGTMVKLIDTLYENGSIDSKAYGALRASAQAEDDSKLKDQKNLKAEAEKTVKAAVEENMPKPSPSDVKVSYKNGFHMESADGQHSLEIHGRIQADYLDTVSGGDGATKDKFNLRRAYLYTQGKLFKNWEHLFVASFQGTPQAVFWEMNAHYWDEAQLKFGQYRFPFSINESTSSRNIDFMERALPMQFIPGIDRGAMLHGNPIQGMYYAVSAVNGGLRNNVGLSSTGLDEDNDVDGKDFLGHLSYNLAPVLEHKDSIYHVGFSYATGEQPTSDPDSALRASTETGALKFFQADQFGDSSVDLSRVGASTVLAHGPLRFTGEYVHNNFQGAASGQAFDRNIDAYYLSAHWMLTGESYAKAFGKQNAFGDIVPQHNFDMKGGWGAWELAFRFSHLDASDFKSTNTAGTGKLLNGFANEADGYTVGLKWIVNPQVRFLANYVHTDFNQPIVSNGVTLNSEDGLNFRAQINY